ncbi:MAG: NAD(P)/FAD-dependent oxidoreductase [Acutalibacteraceae bacterium]
MKKLAIIGAGASGLCAAIEARRENPNIDIVLFDRMSKAGKKILATGNGRCNFTNEDLPPSRFYGNTELLNSILNSQFSDTEDFFKNFGILPYKEDGRIYPRSQQASTVRDALLNKIESNNITVKTDCPVTEISRGKSGFNIYGEIFDAVVISGGGKAASVHGSDGSCYKIAKSFGHSITPLYPALCGLVIQDKNLNLLKGVRAECNVGLYSDETILGCESGEVQFTDQAISGIPVMNLSHLCENKKDLKIRLDLCPEFDEKALFSHIKKCIENSPDTEYEVILNGIVNLKLAFAVMNIAGIKAKTLCKYLKNTQIQRTLKVIKCFEIGISSAKGFDNAQVTKGGINTSEISPETMMSKKVDGLFFCGEILDIHGDCGGYNLHLAFTTGRIAGNSAGKHLK